MVEGIDEEIFSLTIETNSDIELKNSKNNLKHKSTDGEKFLYSFTAKNQQVIDDIFEKFPKEIIVKYSIDR